MDNNFEELLRKAIEASNASGDTDGDDMVPEQFKQMMSILETGALIKLAKSARDKMGKVISDLISDLNACDQKNLAGFHAHAFNKIERAARTLKILNLIMRILQRLSSILMTLKLVIILLLMTRNLRKKSR